MRAGMWLKIGETGQILTTDLGWRITLITYDTGNWAAGVESYFNNTHYYYYYLLLKFDDTHIQTISIYNAIITRVAFFFSSLLLISILKETAWTKKFLPLKSSGVQGFKPLLPSCFTTHTVNKTLTQELENWTHNSNSMAFFLPQPFPNLFPRLTRKLSDCYLWDHGQFISSVWENLWRRLQG